MYILAQYTIRSKQEYIFRSNRMAEMIGASDHISKSWEILFEQAEKTGKKVRRLSEQKRFDIDEVKAAFKNHALHMVDLFQGGGNDTVLFDSKESYLEVNRQFSYYLMKNYPGMIPMAVCCEYTGDYQKDYKRLMEEADREKNRMISGQSSFILPFSMMDRTSFQPYSRVISYEGRPVRITEEGYVKRKRGQEISKEDPTVKILDDMITKKGEESLLAVIHGDGNNMGVKISRMLENVQDYNTCIEKMRQFTADTRRAFVEEGIQAMKQCQERLREENPDLQNSSRFLYRILIAEGDDLTFVCNARFAMDYAKAYLKSVQSFHKRHGSDWRYSSCVGICIFHSHYPFSRAYSMAEQACSDSAKERVHTGGKEVREEGWVDFHYIHNGIGGDLSEVRRKQGTDRCMARPWRVTGGNGTGENDYGKLEKLNELFIKYQVSRGDIKTIGNECENRLSDGKQELIRIYGHHGGLQKEAEAEFPNQNQLLKSVYDLSEVYDLWFKEGR